MESSHNKRANERIGKKNMFEIETLEGWKIKLSNSPGPEFLNLGVTDIWGWKFFVVGGCPVHCNMLSSLPGLYSLDAIACPFFLW